MTTTSQENPKRKMARKKAPPAPKPETFLERHVVKLTEADRQQLLVDLLENDDKIEKLEEEKKDATASIKAKIAEAKKFDRNVKRALRKGEEERDVPVAEEFVFSTNTVRVRRLDTGECVRERAMDLLERGAASADDDAPPARRPEVVMGERADSLPPDGEVTAPQALLDLGDESYEDDE